MMPAKTTLRAEDLPDNLGPLRSAIEQAVPHGSVPRRRGRDPGSWENPPVSVDQVWATLADEFDLLCELHPRLANTNNRKHLGTLG
ncbi:RNA-splicing ligase RtcB, partial [Bacillus sp. AFS017336]